MVTGGVWRRQVAFVSSSHVWWPIPVVKVGIQSLALPFKGRVGWGWVWGFVIPAKAGIQFHLLYFSFVLHFVIPAEAGTHLLCLALCVCRENRLTSLCFSLAIHGERVTSLDSGHPALRPFGVSFAVRAAPAAQWLLSLGQARESDPRAGMRVENTGMWVGARENPADCKSEELDPGLRRDDEVA